ncbi:transient receptor potential cation channel subfamily M member 5-like [Acanthaster planci]|uniref:Transient receptor potential cation channel subfamily M member 5-like n=1 Tax=Acanthaster planci TaxID=133434 RepID=A0A8B8A1Z2_ACAPL|nr:transient receptor potential cation channel subfamily M member 5-like [Acanthaster planci]
MDTYEPLYLRERSKYFLSENDICRGLDRPTEELGEIRREHTLMEGLRAVSNNMARPDSPEKNRDFRSPVRELFLYAVLQNREQMARMFWEEGKEAIPSALTASKILTSLAAKEPDPDQSTFMQSHATSYEDLALGVLNECYNDDSDRTSLLLVREQENWGRTTSLSLAKQADNKNFIAHSGVQNLLTEIWSGKLSDENNYWLVSR